MRLRNAQQLLDAHLRDAPAQQQGRIGNPTT
jgi:hypothetical protein